MAKRKKNKVDRELLDMVLQAQVQNVATELKQSLHADSTFAEREKEGLQYEQEMQARKQSELAYLVAAYLQMKEEFGKLEEDVHRLKKYISKDMCGFLYSLDARYSKMEKKVKGLSEQMDRLHKKESKRAEALKKCRSQIHLQKKALRLVGAYCGLNNTSDNLNQMYKKCAKKMERHCIQIPVRKGISSKKKSKDIIDAEYRQIGDDYES